MPTFLQHHGSKQEKKQTPGGYCLQSTFQIGGDPFRLKILYFIHHRSPKTRVFLQLRGFSLQNNC